MAVDIPLPPARYDHPYTGPAIIRQVSMSELAYRCHGYWGIVTDQIAMGCSWFDSDTRIPICVIYIPTLDEVTLELQQRVLRHEIGHCNGWPGNHPR